MKKNKQNTENLAFNIWFDACMENGAKNNPTSSVRCYEFDNRIYIVETTMNTRSTESVAACLERMLADSAEHL